MASFLKLAVLVAVLSVILYFTREYMQGGVCHSTARLDGKVIVVTGANTGIGKETVRDMISRGAKTYMACRTLSRCEAAAKDVKESTGADDTMVITMILDLASYDSIRNFVADFKKREKQVDVLINNAGVMFIPERILTVDGNEMTMGTNHFGHFLLTNLLLDMLIASAPSRVVTVSSRGHTLVDNLPMDDLTIEKDYSRVSSYSYSKLANVMFSRELAKRLKGTGVTTYSLHPGSIQTELSRHIPFANTTIMQGFLGIVGVPFFKTIPQGAQTQICCAVDEEMGKQTGLYYSDCEVKAPNPYAENDDLCKELWEKSVAITKLKPEEMNNQNDELCKELREKSVVKSYEVQGFKQHSLEALLGNEELK